MSSNRIVCPGCKGSRKVMGMGGITTPDCDTCDGEGYLVKTTQADLDKKLEDAEKNAEKEVTEKQPRKLKRKE